MTDGSHVETGLIHFEMQQASEHAGLNWRDSMLAASIEIAKIVEQLGEHLTPERRHALICAGAGLILADREIESILPGEA